MELQEIKDKVIEILGSVLDSEGKKIDDTTKIFTELGMESIETLEFEFELDEAFGVKVEDQDLWKLPGFLANQQSISASEPPSAEACDILSNSFVGMQSTDWKAPVTVNDIYAAISVKDICNWVKRKQQVA